MANWKHHCSVLGVEQGAGTKTIRRAYRAQALRCHPDLHGANPESKETFQRLNASYHYLLENFWRERPSAQAQKPAEPPKGDPRCEPSPPSKKYWREFAGGSVPMERRNPERPERRTSTHTPRPDGLDRRVNGSDRRVAPEPAVREIRIVLPRFLGRFYWRLQHDRKFYRKVLRASTALLAVLAARAMINLLF